MVDLLTAGCGLVSWFDLMFADCLVWLWFALLCALLCIDLFDSCVCWFGLCYFDVCVGSVV